MYQISYKQTDGTLVDTGQRVGTYGNSSYSYTNTITINDTTDEIRAQVVRYGCATGSARVSEFRIYK